MHRAQLESLVEAAIAERVFPGCVVGVLSPGSVSEIVSAGRFTYDSDSPPATPETIYDLASITKSIPTASLALKFIGDGKLHLSDTVHTYIPELQNDHGATIEDLLRYRVKGPRLSTLAFTTFEEIRTHIFESGFDGPPGESVYANIPSFVLGVILERVGKGSLAALSYHYFFKPFEMDRTTFFPAASDCPPTEIQNGEIIQGIVHDESARKFARKRRSVGHAGLFSNSTDMMKFAEALLDGRLNVVTDGAEIGLGWEQHMPRFMGSHTSPDAFGKTGFTGTSLIVDRAKGKALVILSNRTYPKRPANADAIHTFRATIADIVFS